MEAQQIKHRLRELRHRAGLSQDQLAEASGVPVGTIRGIEQGVVPKMTTLASLAVGLGVEVGFLFEPPSRIVPERVRGGPPKKVAEG